MKEMERIINRANRIVDESRKIKSERSESPDRHTQRHVQELQYMQIQMLAEVAAAMQEIHKSIDNLSQRTGDKLVS